MNEDRRQYDSRIDEIANMVRDMAIKLNEVHQRQQEVTQPRIKEHDETLYSKNGICETVHKHDEQIMALNSRIDKIPTIVGWIFTGISVGAGAILWLIEHGRSIFISKN